MAIDTQRVSLDISKQPTLQVVRLGQGDANGTTLVCTIYDEGQAYDLTGKSVRLRIQLPGGYAEYHVDGTVSGSEATFQVDEAYAASVAGITDNAYVEVLQGTTVVCSTSRFRVVVLQSAYEGTDPAHIWDNGVSAFLQSANAQVRELTQEATQAITEAANAESSAAAELDAALDALGDISEIAVPLMSTTTRGGAKLGSGLAVTDGKLHTQLVQGGQGIANTPIQADGDLLHGLTVNGMCVQDGTPAPSAPVPVQVVETGNRFDPSALLALDGWSVSDGVYSGSSNVWGSVDSPNMVLEVNGGIGQQYTVSFDANVTDGTTRAGHCRFIYSDDTQSAVEIIGQEWKHYVNTSEPGKTVVRVVFTKSNARAVSMKNMQITPGSSELPYFPYGSLGLCVRGRNLLDEVNRAYNDGPREQKGLTLRYEGDGWWHVHGTVTGTSAGVFGMYGNETNIDVAGPGTYSVSFEHVGIWPSNDTLRIQVGIRDVASGTITSAYLYHGTQTKVVTAGNALKYVRLFVASYATGTVVNGRFRIMVEEGSTAHPWTPYVDSTTPITLQSNVLASLPDGTHDELVVDELGRVKLVKRVGKVVFDDTNVDEIVSGYATGDTIAFSMSSNYLSGSTLGLNIGSNEIPYYCDYLVAGTYNDMRYNDSPCVRIINAGKQPAIRIPTSIASTVAEVQAWLAENPITLYYPLATPQVIDLGTIDLPKLADGSTVELLTNLDTGIAADWWAVGAGAIGDGLVKLRDMLTALGAGE